MTERVLGPSGSKRRRRRMLALVAMIGAAFTIFFVAASAATPLTGSTFDAGNFTLTDTTDHDWNPAGSPTGNVGPIDAISCGTTIPGGGDNCGLDRVNSNQDNAYGQGAKEDTLSPSVVNGSIPPQKDDLSRFYVNQERATDDFLYMAWERTNLLGSAHMDFEFNQLFCDTSATPTNCEANGVNPVRSEGDMLFDFDFGGSGQPALTLHKWITTGSASLCEANNTLPCWDKASAHTADLNNNYQASVNGGPVNDYNAPVPSTGFNILAGETKTTGNGANQKTTISSTFGEAGVNLTDAGVFPEDECVHFGSASLKSRSSGESFTSELKDFIAPIPVNISNCGQVIIRKVTDPAGDTTTDFDYTTDVETDEGTAPGFSLKDGESNPIDNVLQGSYNVTEDLVAADADNYTLTDIDCSESTVPAGNIDTDVTAGTIDFDIAPDETLDCTYTNTKNLNNPSGSSSPSVIPQDSVDVSGLDNTGDPDGAAADGKMTFELWDNATCDGTKVYSETVDVTDNETYDTSNTGDPADNNGYTITADGTFYWKIHYNGDDRNNPFDIDCGDEQVDVTLTASS